MADSKLISWALLVALAGAGTGCRAAPDGTPAADTKRLGLMTTLPIYWAEANDVGELLNGGEQPSHARQTLETRFLLDPVDTLEAETLKRHQRLLLAQPRALAPAENVALDGWVRGGGRLLLFADPMLTRHSHFAVGDRRRSQDVVLLSPILTRWGLSLSFDPEQPTAERVARLDGASVPLAQAGKLSRLSGSACEIAADATLAICRIGRGRVTVLADAAVLEDAAADATPSRGEAILSLAKLAFD